MIIKYLKYATYIGNMVGSPEAEKSGLLNCRMSHNFNVSSPDRGMRKKKENELCKKNKLQV